MKTYSSYYHSELDLPSRLGERVGQIMGELTPHREAFATIVVTGLSGIVPGAILAHAWGKRLCIVRKPKETQHGMPIEGSFARPYIVLDDFVASGATIRAIQKMANDNGWGPPEFAVFHLPAATDTYQARDFFDVPDGSMIFPLKPRTKSRWGTIDSRFLPSEA